MSDDYDFDDYEIRDDADDNAGGINAWEQGDPLDQLRVDTFCNETLGTMEDGSGGGALSLELGDGEKNAHGDDDDDTGDADAAVAGGPDDDVDAENDYADDVDDDAVDGEHVANANPHSSVDGGGVGETDADESTAIPAEDALVDVRSSAARESGDDHDAPPEEEDLEYAQQQEESITGDEPLIQLLENVRLDDSIVPSLDDVDAITHAFSDTSIDAVAASDQDTQHHQHISHLPLLVAVQPHHPPSTLHQTTLARQHRTAAGGDGGGIVIQPRSHRTAIDTLEKSWRHAQAQYDAARRHLAGPTVHYEALLEKQVQMAQSPLFRPKLPTLLNQPVDVQTHTILASMYQVQFRTGYQPVEGMSATSSSSSSAVPAATKQLGRRAPRRIDETTVQMPDSAFVPSRHNTDNLIKSQFAVQAEHAFLLWRTHCTIHERMRLRGYALYRGYPPMNEAAFVRTFCMAPEHAGPNVPVWINRGGGGPSGPPNPQLLDLPDGAYGSPAIPHDQLYLETVELPDYDLHKMLPVIDVQGIKRKLSSTYFIRAALLSTDKQAPGPLNTPFDLSRVFMNDAEIEEGGGGAGGPSNSPLECSRSYPYSLESEQGEGGPRGEGRSPSSLPLDPPSATDNLTLRLTANESDTIHVCFLDGADTRMIYKYLTFERENNAAWPEFLRNPKDESSSAPKNERIPIAELFVVTDKEPNETFRAKIRDLHNDEMPVAMRCVIDVWGQERLWINPLKPQMVDRMEIVTHRYPPRVQALVDQGRMQEAKQQALTGYVRMLATDDPVRFLGAQPGNFIRSWKTATKNSNPTLAIVL